MHDIRGATHDAWGLLPGGGRRQRAFGFASKSTRPLSREVTRDAARHGA
jgi:hypothetical protein